MTEFHPDPATALFIEAEIDAIQRDVPDLTDLYNDFPFVAQHVYDITLDLMLRWKDPKASAVRLAAYNKLARTCAELFG